MTSLKRSLKGLTTGFLQVLAGRLFKADPELRLRMNFFSAGSRTPAYPEQAVRQVEAEQGY